MAVSSVTGMSIPRINFIPTPKPRSITNHFSNGSDVKMNIGFSNEKDLVSLAYTQTGKNGELLAAGSVKSGRKLESAEVKRFFEKVAASMTGKKEECNFFLQFAKAMLKVK